MQTKTLEALLIEANELVKLLSYDESLELINNTQTVIIDVREESEVFNLGLIKNAVHIPRGLIEFKLSPNSQNNPVLIDDNTNILVYCAGGYRSALAAKTLLDLGFKNVYNLGGFKEWVESGGEIQANI
ncbi:rhodanese-like domain-containing protein [Gammaproteobacteria bacterium]|nr:rhodanese-like domain-containing protein [Gammaproteobacteria bacterium]